MRKKDRIEMKIVSKVINIADNLALYLFKREKTLINNINHIRSKFSEFNNSELGTKITSRATEDNISFLIKRGDRVLVNVIISFDGFSYNIQIPELLGYPELLENLSSVSYIKDKYLKSSSDTSDLSSIII